MDQKDLWFHRRQGRLDPGLVKELARVWEEGASEEETPIPVIVRMNPELDREQHREALELCREGTGDRLDGELSLLNCVYGQLRPGKIREMTRMDAIGKIFYDRRVKALLDVAAKTTGAVDVRLKEGLTGKGVTIAVVDTGIHPHGDLTQPESRIKAFVDLVNGSEEPYDDQGHGTHCAGDAVANGSLSEGLYVGPAPEAQVIGLKVLDEQGGGRLSTVIRGVQWCIHNRDHHGIRMISLSLGAPAFESHRDDPLCQAVEAAWHEGIVVFAAAGNEGPEAETISTPGISPTIITVGAIDDRNTVDSDDDEKAPYSSRGPTPDDWVKPDIYAPGTSIVSLSVPGSPLERQLPENRVGEHYISLSGTSMATPFCAGVAALLLEANPRLSPNDIKSILMQTAQPLEEDSSRIVRDPAGVVDVRRAVELAQQYLRFQEGLVPGAR